MAQESLRGVLRGNAWRERNLVPGSVKSRVRRRRWLLVNIYVMRFGKDGFIAPFLFPRLDASPRPKWLPLGFAHWRERITP